MEKFIPTRKVMKDMQFPGGVGLLPDKSFTNARDCSLAFPPCTCFIAGSFTAWLRLPTCSSNNWSPKFRDQQFLVLTVMMISLSSLIVNSMEFFFYYYNLSGTLYSDSLINHLFSQATVLTFHLFQDGLKLLTFIINTLGSFSPPYRLWIAFFPLSCHLGVRSVCRTFCRFGYEKALFCCSFLVLCSLFLSLINS